MIKFVRDYWNKGNHQKCMVISGATVSWCTTWGLISYMTSTGQIILITVAGPIVIGLLGAFVYQIACCFID
jgi:hypothetical protein